jgi:DNA topoisomerase I
METELDEVAEAEKDWKAMLRAFATPFEQRVEQKLKEAQRVKIEKAPPEPTGEHCPECGQPLVLRAGRYGPFVACSAYPTCKYVKREPKAQPKVTDIPCPQCGRPLVERVARKGKGAGKPFLGCSGYPKCKHTQQIAAPAESAQGSREPEAVSV